MNVTDEDTQRTFNASLAMIDGRSVTRYQNEILVTLEHTVATLLILLMDHNPRKAAQMLNEGLVPGIEERLALFASKEAQ